MEAQQVCPCRLLVNVPKRLHKRAVARNLIRRRIKEAYRLNKHHFYKQLREKRIQMAILYTSPKLLDYDFISQKLTEAEEMLLAKIRINN